MAKKVIVFAPHPDDAEFYAGGTLTRMIAEGDKVVIVVATDGSKGSFEHAGDALAALRRSEALQAAKVLGAEPPIMLDTAILNWTSYLPGNCASNLFTTSASNSRMWSLPRMLLPKVKFIPTTAP